MTAYTHRAKRAHYGVNDKVEKKDFQKDKNSDDTGGGNGCDKDKGKGKDLKNKICLLYTSPSPRDLSTSRMPSSA